MTCTAAVTLMDSAASQLSLLIAPPPGAATCSSALALISKQACSAALGCQWMHVRMHVRMLLAGCCMVCGRMSHVRIPKVV